MSDPGTTWFGSSMDDIYKGRGPWSFEMPPINVTKHHSVLYELPVMLKAPPKPHISSQVFHWDDNHVRMPYSPQNLFPVENANGDKCVEERWGIIEAALLQPIHSSRQMEAIISSYNTRLPKFLALHHFFEEILEEEEAAVFFSNLLPKIIGLALRLPEILPGSLPLLKQNCNKSVSLSQLQVASLLANAFLCTFPWRKESAATYPGPNFIRLFAAHLRPKREQAVSEKLKAICHYFRRVTDVEPIGVVTFERKHIQKSQLPDWEHNNKNLGETIFHVSNKGVIEDDGLGLLQVDFANKNVGGGVLGFGCVQEEIRYIICPELIISRLFTEQLGPTEALVVIGAERYSNYGGYGDTFMWNGNCNDTTPHDAWGRKRTTIVAIDALRFNKPIEQYNPPSMLRELNKAYAGFHSHLQQLPAVATGNWGCGAFRGDPRLKALLQLMACSATHRDLVYYTFGNEELQHDLYKMHSFIVSQQIKISQLWKYLLKFTQMKNVKPEHLYSFIHQAHLDSKSKPSIKTFFGGFNFRKQDNKNSPSTSTDCNKAQVEATLQKFDDSETTVIDSSQEIIEASQETIDSSPEIIESSQPEETLSSVKSKHLPDVREQNEILHMFDILDGDVPHKNNSAKSVGLSNIELSTTHSNKHRKIKTPLENSPKHKITDYFLKIDKG